MLVFGWKWIDETLVITEDMKRFNIWKFVFAIFWENTPLEGKSTTLDHQRGVVGKSSSLDHQKGAGGGGGGGEKGESTPLDPT